MPISSAPTMLANMPFNLVTDFRPVARLSASYNVGRQPVGAGQFGRRAGRADQE
jgi:hypothetical protein